MLFNSDFGINSVQDINNSDFRNNIERYFITVLKLTYNVEHVELLKIQTFFQNAMIYDE